MRKTIIGALIGATAVITLSMTISDTTKDTRFNAITLTVPAKPRQTAYVGHDQLNEYLKKGYQVQQVVTGDYNEPRNHHFLMVKY